MVDRRDLGSWLGGDGGSDADGRWSGERLGLPQSGAGSLAGTGRRALALIIDWAACSLIAAAFLGYRWAGTGASSFAPLAVFAAENVILVGTLGSTLGHRALGIRVRSIAGAPAGPLAAIVRTALLCLVIPAVIWDQDGRGMHDKAAGTLAVRG